MGRNSSQAVTESTPSTQAIIDSNPVPVAIAKAYILTAKINTGI
jgi:hypothetical protein